MAVIFTDNYKIVTVSGGCIREYAKSKTETNWGELLSPKMQF